MQAVAAMAAAGEPLQEGAALPHGATRLVWPGSCIAGDPFLVRFIALPVDEARMMLRDQHLPLGAGQVSQALPASTGGIQDRLLAGFAIWVGHGIPRVVVAVSERRLACSEPAALSSLPTPSC